MVVKRSVLFQEHYFNGFCSARDYNFEQIIRQNLFYEKRGQAEQTPELKQPVGYCLIVNPTLRQVFAYQRSAVDREYSEKRLQGKWSWGIGGHMEKVDAGNHNPIEASMLRELAEEVEINADCDFEVLGYINDDTTPVGQVHFGILYLVKTAATQVRARDKEIAHGRLVELKKITNILHDPECQVESWSEIATGPLQEFMTRTAPAPRPPKA